MNGRCVIGSHLQGKTRLATAAGADERHKALCLEQGRDLGRFVFSPDELRQPAGEFLAQARTGRSNDFLTVRIHRFPICVRYVPPATLDPIVTGLRRVLLPGRGTTGKVTNQQRAKGRRIARHARQVPPHSGTPGAAVRNPGLARGGMKW